MVSLRKGASLLLCEIGLNLETHPTVVFEHLEGCLVLNIGLEPLSDPCPCLAGEESGER